MKREFYIEWYYDALHGLWIWKAMFEDTGTQWEGKFTIGEGNERSEHKAEAAAKKHLKDWQQTERNRQAPTKKVIS